jgi:hypothetical protein
MIAYAVALCAERGVRSPGRRNDVLSTPRDACGRRSSCWRGIRGASVVSRQRSPPAEVRHRQIQFWSISSRQPQWRRLDAQFLARVLIERLGEPAEILADEETIIAPRGRRPGRSGRAHHHRHRAAQRSQSLRRHRRHLGLTSDQARTPAYPQAMGVGNCVSGVSKHGPDYANAAKSCGADRRNKLDELDELDKLLHFWDRKPHGSSSRKRPSGNREAVALR